MPCLCDTFAFFFFFFTVRREGGVSLFAVSQWSQWAGMVKKGFDMPLCILAFFYSIPNEGGFSPSLHFREGGGLFFILHLLEAFYGEGKEKSLTPHTKAGDTLCFFGGCVMSLPHHCPPGNKEQGRLISPFAFWQRRGWKKVSLPSLPQGGEGRREGRQTKLPQEEHTALWEEPF